MLLGFYTHESGPIRKTVFRNLLANQSTNHNPLKDLSSSTKHPQIPCKYHGQNSHACHFSSHILLLTIQKRRCWRYWTWSVLPLVALSQNQWESFRKIKQRILNSKTSTSESGAWGGSLRESTHMVYYDYFSMNHCWKKYVQPRT